MKKYILLQFAALLCPVLAQAVIPDNFANRQVLTGDFVQATNTNQNATLEVGEPSATGYRTLWYSWTAPDTGEVTITLDGGDSFLKVLSVWMGNSLGGLKTIVAGTPVTFPVVQGTVYAISTGSYYSGDYGNIQINVSLDTGSTINTLSFIGPGTTTNDLFVNRILSSTEFGSYLVYNGSSGRETLEPTPGYKTMWWTYRAPATGRLTITTAGSWNLLKTISVWSGSAVQNLLQLIPEVSGSDCLLPVVQGNDYQVCVSSYYSGDGGPIVLTFMLDTDSDLNSFNLSGGAVFTNNNFNSAAVLTGASPAVIFYNDYATREALEPANNGYRTLWFKWTAPVAGQTQILTQGSDSFLKLITVYTGTTINTLTQVVQSSALNLATATFTAVAGQTYYISLGCYYSGDSGSVLLSIFGQPGTPTADHHRPTGCQTPVPDPGGPHLSHSAKPGSKDLELTNQQHQRQRRHPGDICGRARCGYQAFPRLRPVIPRAIVALSFAQSHAAT
jgi:hypothetical protein